MNKDISLWKASKSNSLFWSSLSMTILALILTFVMVAYSGNFLGTMAFLIPITGCLVLAISKGSLFGTWDRLEVIINHHLKKLNVWPFYEKQDVEVVFDSSNHNKLAWIKYNSQTYFLDSPSFSGYDFAWEFYAPGVFLCTVSFRNSQRSSLIFVIERLDVDTYITTVYKIPK